MEAQLAQAILLASFFERFYMLFHGELNEDAFIRARSVLDFFGAESFGTLYLNSDGSLRPGREAGYLDGNRKSDYGALEAKFAYGRGPRLDDQS